jgi:hypothetical protein
MSRGFLRTRRRRNQSEVTERPICFPHERRPSPRPSPIRWAREKLLQRWNSKFRPDCSNPGLQLQKAPEGWRTPKPGGIS